MKTLILALLVGAWATTLLWQRHGSRPSPRVVQAPVRSPLRSAADTAPFPTATPSASSATVGHSLPFRTAWEAFQAENLPAFIRLLRASGCPEDSVRLFAVAAVGRGIQQRLEEPLRQEVRLSTWWQASPLHAHRALRQAMRRARQELDDTLAPLTSETADALRTELTGGGPSAEPWLAGNKRARLSPLRSGHASEIEDVVARAFPGTIGPSLNDELRSELRSLRQRQREELRVLLGPADCAEYEARESPEAEFVRLHLPEARDEAEFRVMVQAAIEVAVEPYDATFESAHPYIPADAFPDRAPNPREQVLARFRELSSPDRAAEFDRERVAEEERQAQEAKAQAELSALTHLQDIARAGGTELSQEEARRLGAALQQRSAELEKEWGTPPTSPTDAERKSLEDRIAQEFEAVAISVLGERGGALVAEMRRQTRNRTQPQPRPGRRLTPIERDSRRGSRRSPVRG